MRVLFRFSKAELGQTMFCDPCAKGIFNRAFWENGFEPVIVIDRIFNHAQTGGKGG